MVTVVDEDKYIREGIAKGLGGILSRLAQQQREANQQVLDNQILTALGGLPMQPTQGGALNNAMENAPQENSMQQGTLENTMMNAPEEISDAVLATGLGSKNPTVKALAESIYKDRQAQNKVDYSLREKNAEKMEEKALEFGETIPETEIALDRVERALESGQTSGWWNSFANLLPEQYARLFETDDAQLLKSAIKTLFLKDLQGMVGQRANQLIERVLLNSLAGIGKSEAANQEFLEAARIALQMKKNYLEAIDEISARGGRLPPKNMRLEVQKLTKQKNDQLAKDLDIAVKDIKNGKIKNNYLAQMRKAQKQEPPQGKSYLALNGQVGLVNTNELPQYIKQGGRAI